LLIDGEIKGVRIDGTRELVEKLVESATATTVA